MLRWMDVSVLGNHQESGRCVVPLTLLGPNGSLLPQPQSQKLRTELTLLMTPPADDPSLASHLFSTFSFTRGLGALLCAPIASALISHPFTSASDKTAYGVSDGKYGGVVLFAGLAMAVGAGLEAVEWLLSPPKRVA